MERPLTRAFRNVRHGREAFALYPFVERKSVGNFVGGGGLPRLFKRRDISKAVIMGSCFPLDLVRITSEICRTGAIIAKCVSLSTYRYTVVPNLVGSLFVCFSGDDRPRTYHIYGWASFSSSFSVLRVRSGCLLFLVFFLFNPRRPL